MGDGGWGRGGSETGMANQAGVLLQGIRVLDYGSAWQGPQGTVILNANENVAADRRRDADSEIDAGIGDIDWAGRALSAGVRYRKSR